VHAAGVAGVALYGFRRPRLSWGGDQRLAAAGGDVDGEPQCLSHQIAGEAGVPELRAADARTNGAAHAGLWPASAGWQGRDAHDTGGREDPGDRADDRVAVVQRWRRAMPEGLSAD
jgi:hypothetical protein